MDYGNNNEQQKLSSNFEKKIDCGYIKLDLDTIEKEYQIKFNHSFSRNPIITFGFSRSGYIANTHIGIRSNTVSSIGFTLMAVSDSVTVNKTIDVYWIAIEP